MAANASATNELVMSNEDIAASLADLQPDPVPLDPEPADLGSDADEGGQSPWEDREEEDTEEAPAEVDTPARSKKSATAVKEYKANGKTHQVDLGDQAAVDRLITLGLGARPVFSERDKLSKSNKELSATVTDLQKYKTNWDKLEARKGDKEALYEAIFGTKWADDVKAARDYQDRYANASPAEQRWMDAQKQLEADRAQFARERKDRDAADADLAKKADDLQLKTLRGTMLPEFQRLEFSSRIKDENAAAKLNKALWKLTISDLKETYGEADDIPASAIRKAFKETHDMLWANHKTAATAEVKQITDEKKKAAKEQAQVASTRNYSSGAGKDLSKVKGDPVKLWKKMFK